VRGLKIGFLGFYLRDPDKAVSDARRARPKVDVLIVFNHWGRDDASEVLPLQRRLGRALIDAGVDLVAGAHTHVLQPEEWYRGKLIFYGLGNFVFSGQNYDEAHRTGGYLEATVGPAGLIERKFYRTRLSEAGAPRWLDDAPVEPARTRESEPPPEKSGSSR
jgi:poly-gamma-glutamate synthesis protein (capsule biosynthesis protein)